MPASTSSSAGPDPHLWITILAGGSGTRFWPLSTPGRPKQLLPLAGPNPLIRDTLDRARNIAPGARVRILTGSHLVGPFRDALDQVAEEEFMVEPRARGTGPVLTWAAWTAVREDPEAVLISLHADHAIDPWRAFQELMTRGAELAAASPHLFTVAVPPTRPETGYGYIRPGDLLGEERGTGAFRVKAFVEKPDRTRAEEYVEAGYFWNSGIFIWKASVFLDEVRAVAPELAAHLPLLEAGRVEDFFSAVPNISVDEAILERSARVASIPASFSWDDVGSWEALCRTCPSDEEGNVVLGSGHLHDARRNIVMMEEGRAVLFGVEDLVVVRRGDIVMVASRERAPELKELLAQLPPSLRNPDAS